MAAYFLALHDCIRELRGGQPGTPTDELHREFVPAGSRSYGGTSNCMQKMCSTYRRDAAKDVQRLKVAAYLNAAHSVARAPCETGGWTVLTKDPGAVMLLPQLQRAFLEADAQHGGRLPEGVAPGGRGGCQDGNGGAAGRAHRAASATVALPGSASATRMGLGISPRAWKASAIFCCSAATAA